MMEFVQKNSDQYTVGGKARNLFLLQKSGIGQVPGFVVITQESGLAVLPEKLLEENDFNGICSFIKTYTFPDGFIDRLCQTIPGRYFAVRSSAADEDGADYSFAGQFESDLFVTKETMEQSIRKVWLSAYSDRVRQYRERNGIRSRHGIAVIVQVMIDAESSGVGFGMNPASGDRNEKVISAVFGLGEGLVSGELNADNYYVKEGKIRKEITKKTAAVCRKENRPGTELQQLPSEQGEKPALTDEMAMTVARALDRLKKFYGRPMDIEFAFAGGTFYLLQARPITQLSRVSDKNGQYIVWDNSNIIESYPGVTTPLTFSFILRMYESAYWNFSELMGISEKDREANRNVYANMLGLLNGRVYYNLRSWYKLLSLLPGYSLNAGFMEKMMGVKERFELDDYVPRTKFRERLRILNMLRVMLRNLRRLPKMRQTFQQGFDETMTRYRSIDFDSCDAWKLMQLYKDFEQIMLERWKAPLVNDFFAMIYYGTLQKMVLKYQLDEQGMLHNDLLCGARDIVSTDPVKRCTELSEMIASDTEATDFFRGHDETQIWEALQQGRFPAIAQKANEYIERWGDRCVGELKLETVTYRQNPAAFIRIIKSYVTQQVKAQHSDTDLNIRRQAEQTVERKLGGRLLKKMLFRYVLRKTREMVSSRENLRFARTRGFGMVRDIFCALGRNFYSEGLLDEPRDIFYLKKEEIFDFIQGTSVQQDLRPLITLRKKEFAAYAAPATAERIPSYGMVYHGNDFRHSAAARQISGDLKGIGCCAGQVKARIRVVHDPNEVSDLNGDILVTSSTDPGWVTLFPTASAILVERGSLLSHSAIVSREMGKPCIVGITGLLGRVKTGDLVEMDGSTGEIKIVNE